MDNFKLGMIDAMVAMKCLAEGIDVPACWTAYILASSRKKNMLKFMILLSKYQVQCWKITKLRRSCSNTN